ncbi:flagellar protein FliS [bacterium]|nr:flagellar protein FliS [bacterium]
MNNYMAYQKAMTDRIGSSSTETLMVMLFENAITKLKQADERFKMQQRIPALEAVNKTIKIVDALMEHVNTSEGGDVAVKLVQLYHYTIHELSLAVLPKEDPVLHLKNALAVLESLLQAWKGLEKKQNEERS